MSFGEPAGFQNIAHSVNVRICQSKNVPLIFFICPTSVYTLFWCKPQNLFSQQKSWPKRSKTHSIYAAHQLLRAILAKRESGELLPPSFGVTLESRTRTFLPSWSSVCAFLGNYLQIIPRLFEYWNNYGTMDGSARASGNTHWGDWRGNSQAPMDHWSVEDWFCFLPPVMGKKRFAWGKSEKINNWTPCICHGKT